MTELSISLLGPFRATIEGRSLVPFRTRSVQALLIYLVCHADRAHQREALMELLWPGMPRSSAQANMRQTLYRLRQAVPQLPGREGAPAVPFLLADRQAIQVNPQAVYFADVQAFTMVEADDPQRAVALYRGDFLEDFYLPDSEEFEAWAAVRRADFRRRVLDVLELAAADAMRRADFEEAERLARRQLAIDNLREVGHRQLLEALVRSGHRREALAQYDAFRDLLQHELAIEPEAETLELAAAIRSGELAAARPGAPRTSYLFDDQPAETRHNLPQPLASSIGREQELAAVTRLVNTNRLVMLTGVGGIGKTHLCQQVGRHLLAGFEDGVWLVELAAIADPALVPQAVANALGLRLTSGQEILEVLRTHLREKHLLLILDNCEHVIEAAARLVETLLQACPELKILASSREALSLPGEVPFRVPPLSLPADEHPPSVDEWQRYDALRLFVERAQTTHPDFKVSEENLGALVQISRRLDGIPLALELAAARVPLLAVQQIADRLDDRFRLLTGGSRTALPRQQTLRALFDWSWDLLTHDEQCLLSRLSLFVVTMDLEAIETVCAGDGLSESAILDLLAGLANKSLLVVHREAGRETRYRLLETIRHYAQERLAASGQGESFRDRYLLYYVHLASRAGKALQGPDQVAWMLRLKNELDNIRSALGYAYEKNRPAGLRLATELWCFWGQGYVREGEAWLAKFLASREGVAAELAAKALVVQAGFNFNMARNEQACRLAEESLDLFRQTDDREGIAYSMGQVGWIALWTEEYSRGRRLLMDSLALFQELDDKLGMAQILEWMGYREWKFNYDQAMAYLAQSEALYREVGHLAGIVGVRNSCAQLATWQGDYESARRMLEEGLAFQQQVGLRGGAYSLQLLGELYYWLGDYQNAGHYLQKSLWISEQNGETLTAHWAVVRLAYVFLRTGDLAKARALFLKSLALFTDAKDSEGIVFALEGTASLASLPAQASLASRLLGWADMTRKVSHNPRPPVEQRDVDRQRAALVGALGEAAFAAQMRSGKVMTMEQAAVVADQLLQHEVPPHPP